MIVFTDGLCRIGGFIGCSFIMERNMVDDYCLFGHVFANFSAAGVTECYQTCQTNCRCISFNFLKSINQNNCQLNEENRHTKPGALKPMSGSQYYELVTNYKVTVRHKIFRHHSPSPPFPPPPTSNRIMFLLCTWGEQINTRKPQLFISELAERSPIIIQSSRNPLSRKSLDVRLYDRTRCYF